MGTVNKIVNVADPTNPQDVATKAYVDTNAGSSKYFKDAVRVATVGTNITLAGSAPNTLDGVTLAANDRILVKDQTTASQNGIYVVTTLGTGANGTWSRSSDADTSAEVVSGFQVFVSEGTVHADSVWSLTTNAPVTLDTTSLVFQSYYNENNNTVLGRGALAILGAGTSNTAVGKGAGDTITTGTNNTCIGHDADVNSATASNRIVIGQGASGTTDNFVQLGNSSVTAGAIGPTGIMLQGKRMTPVMASAMKPSTTSGASAVTWAETATNKVMLGYIEFADAVTSYAHFSIPMPKSWNESTMTFQFGWYSPTATGNVVWGVQAVAVSDDDLLDAAWGTEQTVTDGVTVANDMLISAETPALTAGGTPVENDHVFFRVYRKGADASDTAAGVVRLLWVRAFFTYNAGNDA